jgi:hypothetical protein
LVRYFVSLKVNFTIRLLVARRAHRVIEEGVMKRAAWVGIGAAFTTVVALRASAQVVVGMQESYIQPPPKLSGTLICRGGDELLFEGPLTTVRTRASLVPPGKVVSLADMVTYVDVSVRRLIFQTASGPAGNEGRGLKPSQCAYTDHVPTTYVAPALEYDASSEAFQVISDGATHISRRSTVEDYLRDVNHFWAFDVIDRESYYEVKAHRRFDVMQIMGAADRPTAAAAQINAAQQRRPRRKLSPRP